MGLQVSPYEIETGEGASPPPRQPLPTWRYFHGPVSRDLSQLWRVFKLEMLLSFESRRFVRTGTEALSGTSYVVDLKAVDEIMRLLDLQAFMQG